LYLTTKYQSKGLKTVGYNIELRKNQLYLVCLNVRMENHFSLNISVWIFHIPWGDIVMAYFYLQPKCFMRELDCLQCLYWAINNNN